MTLKELLKVLEPFGGEVELHCNNLSDHVDSIDIYTTEWHRDVLKDILKHVEEKEEEKE